MNDVVSYDDGFIFDFSREIWHQTYKYHTDETVQDTHRRVAKDLASIEKDPAKWEELFYDALKDFKVVPGGRISSNAGTGLKGASYINCVVGGPICEDKDSIDGIFSALSRAALTLKSECGYGFCSDFIRPRGAFIAGVGVESPGAVEFLRLWDTMSDVITKGSGLKKKDKKSKNKIRKGAMLVSMSAWNPSIEEFIMAKTIPGKLTKFNMSVLCSDAFMNAVKERLPWKLMYPDTTFEKYKVEWDGFLDSWIEKGYPTITYKEYNDASTLWDLIMTNNYHRAEPGVLFVDRINHLNNLKYIERISASNPCGEQVLPVDSSCLLGSLNLINFVDIKNKDWDYSRLEKYIPIFVRMLDNVNDKTTMPLQEQVDNLLNKRRIGVGYLGYASALYLLGVRYGSETALQLTDKLAKFVTNQCYCASALIAKEKGHFPLYDEEKYLLSNFISQALTKETISLIKKYGIRNSHLTSIQPVGNGSIYANNVTSGLEPMVSSSGFVRTSIVPIPPDGLLLPTIDWSTGTGYDQSTWKQIKEGDENILATNFNGQVYKFDRNRGLTKETLVEDYAIHLLKKSGGWDEKSDWVADISNLKISDHTETMKVFAKYIDSAMSKTINVPNNYPFEDFKNVYIDLYYSGVVKGATTYREGTMTHVVSTKATEIKSDGGSITKHNAPKRPNKLPCDVHQLTVSGEKWVVFVGLLDGQPYEVFAGLMEKVSLNKKTTSGELVKYKSGAYGFVNDDVEILDINSVFNNPTQGSITRLTSMSLRHGVDTKFVVTQLLKSENGISTFTKCLARTLKKYIKEGEELTDMACPQCSSKSIIMVEGCNKCQNCGYSGCN